MHFYIINYCMIQKLFSIYFLPTEDSNLFIEIGKQHIACWCTGDKKSLQAFEYFTFHDTDEQEDFEKIFKDARLHSVLLNNTFTSTQLVWQLEGFSCIPNNLFAAEKIDHYIDYSGCKSPLANRWPAVKPITPLPLL